MNSTIVMHRLLRIERHARALAELLGDEACKANTADASERPARMQKLWSEIVRDVGVIDVQAKGHKQFAAELAALTRKTQEVS